MHDADPKDDTYGPWMVVSCKKASNRKDKRYSPPINPMHARRHKGTEEHTALEGANKMTPGMGSFKITKGKRKANGELVNVGESSREFSGFKGKWVSVESPNKLGLFKEGATKGYEGPLSIKGKKVMARLRAALANSRSPDSQEGNKARKFPKTIWSPTNKHLPPINNGEFRFLSKSRNEVGNTLKEKNCDNPICGDQSQAIGSMEMVFSANTSECKDGQHEPRVVSSVQRFGDREGEEANLGE
nr:hypothetical protein CFP56_17558 [Quercus suber]